MKKRTKGFSLIELLVALVIGIFLLGGLVILMANSKKNFAQQDYSARLQENARFAMQFMSFDIRMGGYLGCSNTLIGTGDGASEVNAFGGCDECITGHGDQITINYGRDDEVVELLDIADLAANANVWTVSRIPEAWGTDGDAIGQDLVVSDCGGAVTVRATVTDAENGDGDSVLTLDWNDTSNKTFASMETELGRTFLPDGDSGAVTLRTVASNAYSVATGASGVPSLFQGANEVVEGVENIQILFQENAGAGFATAATVPDNVSGAKLGILVRSVSNENLDDRQFGAGTDITVDDGVHTVLTEDLDLADIRGQRRVFGSTLQVRNSSL